jgi:hypothetical protein
MNLRHGIAAVGVTAAALSLTVVPALAATASETITGGLTTSAPDMTFSPVTLTGVATTQSGTYTLAVNDLTGNNAGWHVTIAGAALSDGGPVSLAVTATPPIAAPCTVIVAGCIDLPANVAATAPFVISTTAVPLYSAAVNTGELAHNVVTPMSVAIPANVGGGTYTSTWTVSVTSGP